MRLAVGDLRHTHEPAHQQTPLRKFRHLLPFQFLIFGGDPVYSARHPIDNWARRDKRPKIKNLRQKRRVRHSLEMRVRASDRTRTPKHSDVRARTARSTFYACTWTTQPTRSSSSTEFDSLPAHVLPRRLNLTLTSTRPGTSSYRWRTAVILLLFVPDDGQASAGLLLDVGRSPAEHMEFEACIERRNGTLQIRPTLWAQHHSEATTPEAICDLLQDPAWSSDVDDVAEVLDYLRRWSQLPVVNVTAVG